MFTPSVPGVSHFIRVNASKTSTQCLFCFQFGKLSIAFLGLIIILTSAILVFNDILVICGLPFVDTFQLKHITHYIHHKFFLVRYYIEKMNLAINRYLKIMVGLGCSDGSSIQLACDPGKFLPHRFPKIAKSRLACLELFSDPGV